MWQYIDVIKKLGYVEWQICFEMKDGCKVNFGQMIYLEVAIYLKHITSELRGCLCDN